MVVGTGSSILAGPDGPQSAYPARLEAALARRLPGVAVKVVDPGALAPDDRRIWPAALSKVLADEKPDLVIWQTGTVDAIRRIDPDVFRDALSHGLDDLHKGGADVILMNMQYSPRTESMIALGPFVDTLAGRRPAARSAGVRPVQHHAALVGDRGIRSLRGRQGQRACPPRARLHRARHRRARSSMRRISRRPRSRPANNKRSNRDETNTMHREFLQRRSSVVLAAAVTLLMVGAARSETVGRPRCPRRASDPGAGGGARADLHGRCQQGQVRPAAGEGRTQAREPPAAQDRGAGLVVDVRRRRHHVGRFLSEPAGRGTGSDGCPTRTSSC